MRKKEQKKEDRKWEIESESMKVWLGIKTIYNVYQFNTCHFSSTHIHAEYEPELRLANICIKCLCM